MTAILIIAALLVAILLASAIATAISFPWSTDAQADEGTARDFYRHSYTEGVETIADKSYSDFGREAAIKERIPDLVDGFISQYGLRSGKVLEVGAGSGLMQDLVPDYTGLDLSPTAGRFFHKPFIAASATDMPFPDNAFDALWSIWVLEHVPNPERALMEIRRIVKPNGYLLLVPALEVDRYAANGYKVRPYSDFNLWGKLIKSTIPITDSQAWHLLQYHQLRLLRFLRERFRGGPSRLHFMRLRANYQNFWVPDSDATTSVSFQELVLWFRSRGDECIGCPSDLDLVLHDSGAPLIVKIRK